MIERECQICFSNYKIGEKRCSSCGAQVWPELPCNDDYTEPAIEITDNGIFKGSVIGVKASATIDGKTLFAFGPDAEIAKQRLQTKILQKLALLCGQLPAPNEAHA